MKALNFCQNEDNNFGTGVFLDEGELSDGFLNEIESSDGENDDDDLFGDDDTDVNIDLDAPSTSGQQQKRPRGKPKINQDLNNIGLVDDSDETEPNIVWQTLEEGNDLGYNHEIIFD
ncbi:hypothetical protein J6590_098805 [Homalodisca vitripennis]|nr:hypothetical protein J6590_098805 [Homalodisca vitripennis]